MAALYSGEDYTGERTFIASSATELSSGSYRSILVCRGSSSSSSSSSTSGSSSGKSGIGGKSGNMYDEDECTPGAPQALSLCTEEVQGDELSLEAALSKTDAARFGYLGKGIKARKFRPLVG